MYVKAVKRRIGAESLVKRNMEVNPGGPEVGDMMLSEEHAAIVFRVYPRRAAHPFASTFAGNATAKNAIPRFPGDLQARKEVDKTQYFRDDSPPLGPAL